MEATTTVNPLASAWKYRGDVFETGCQPDSARRYRPARTRIAGSRDPRRCNAPPGSIAPCPGLVQRLAPILFSQTVHPELFEGAGRKPQGFDPSTGSGQAKLSPNGVWCLTELYCG